MGFPLMIGFQLHTTGRSQLWAASREFRSGRVKVRKQTSSRCVNIAGSASIIRLIDSHFLATLFSLLAGESKADPPIVRFTVRPGMVDC